MTDEERAIDVEGRQQKIAQLLGGGIPTKETVTGYPLGNPTAVVSIKPTRKPRSDKGIPKGPKPKAQPAGLLSREQIAHIDSLVTAMTNANSEAHNAAQVAYRACVAYHAYLDELAGIKP